MKYIINNKIRIVDPTPEMKNYVEENLVIPNPDYITNERLGYSNWKTPRYLVWYEIDGNDIIVPFGFFNWLWDFDRDIRNYDCRIVLGKNLQYKSNIQLYDYQEQVIQKALQAKNGIIVMPAGSGKTQTALEIIARLRQKSIMDNAYNRFVKSKL